MEVVLDDAVTRRAGRGADHVELVLRNRQDFPHQLDLLSLISRGKNLSIQIHLVLDDVRRFFRLRPGGEVRLRNAYIIRCDDVVRGADGEPEELHCSIDPDSRSGGEGARRKVKGTIHWVSAPHSIPAELRLYRPLFTVERPDLASGTPPLSEQVNPRSLEVAAGARLEPSLASAGADDTWQFERLGYFTPDPVDSSPSALIFNRIAPLRSSYSS